MAIAAAKVANQTVLLARPSAAAFVPRPRPGEESRARTGARDPDGARSRLRVSLDLVVPNPSLQVRESRAVLWKFGSPDL